jgi:hypothetical protein
MSCDCGPESLTTAIAPIPGAVATAQMVSSDKKLVIILKILLAKIVYFVFL